MAKKKLAAHDNLVYMVIKRQAGPLGKAALEGVMNSIDAGATRIDIHMTSDRLVIIDDGTNYNNTRVIRVGESTCAAGWTDGKTYVAIDQGFLSRHLPITPYSAVSLVQLYLHELCHNAPDTEDHGHDIDFYKTYHDSSKHVEGWAAILFEHYIRTLRNALRKIPKKVQLCMGSMTEADALHKRVTTAAEIAALESK